MAGPLVLDASAAVDMLVNGPGAAWLMERTRDHDLIAPGHAPAEMLNGVARVWRRGAISSSGAERVLREMERLPLEIASTFPLFLGAWARRDQHSLPDALYIELAAQLDTVVVTTDRRLARATPLAVAPPEE